MQTTVVFFSKFGHTQKVAEVIADALQTAGPVRLLALDQLVPAQLQGADLVIMGTPTHRMNLPTDVRPLLARLPSRCLQHIHVAAFDTSYKMSWWLAPFTAARKLSRWLRKLGGKQVAAPQSFHVMAMEGPLYEGELGRAREWALTSSSERSRGL